MRKSKMEFDQEELEILRDFERGEFESIRDFQEEKKELEDKSVAERKPEKLENKKLF